MEIIPKLAIGGLGLILAIEILSHNGLIQTKTDITQEKGRVLPAEKDPRPEENLPPGMIKPSAVRPATLMSTDDVGPVLSSFAQRKPMIDEEEAKRLNIQARFLYG